MEVFDYEDIQLIPNKSIVSSRTECNTQIKFGPRTFKIPVVPANMQTVINEEVAVWLASHDYFYIMHRFDEEARKPFIKMMRGKGLFTSISIGIKHYEYNFVRELVEEELIPEYVTIDVAHGHSEDVLDMVRFIKEMMPTTFLIAGNVGTPEGVRELENAGADATKVGVGPGRVCITKLKTGFGTGGWQLAAIRACAKAARKPIIADGGIRHNGDIAKSVRFGASMVMVGSLLAAHEESPGRTRDIDGKVYKEYFGSASEFQKGTRQNIEGKIEMIAARGKLSDTLVEMEQDLQSSISYAGGRDLDAIRKVDYVIVRNSIFNGDR